MDDKKINEVWNKGEYFNDNYNKDLCGALMKKSEYGNRQSNYGWEIDHITPKSEGGADQVSNLRPLHWKNNAARQAGRLNTTNPQVKAFVKDKEKKTWANAEYNTETKKYSWL